VLLENRNNLLPLDAKTLRGLAVIGPAAVRKTHFLRHLYAKNDQVAKTGSGQTYLGIALKKEMRFL
jgi:hypothetical protein